METVRQDRPTFVLLESPYAGDVATHEIYAKRAMRDSLKRGEAPFASHMLYTQMLDDNVPPERDLGIKAGLAIGEYAQYTVVYADYGISRGMQQGIDAAHAAGRSVVYRHIGMNST